MSERWVSLWRGLNWPNRISVLRLLGVAPMAVLLLYQRQWPPARHLALAVLLAMAASDALDGYLARWRGQITRLGRFLDPLADKLLIITTVVLLATQTAGVAGAVLPGWVVVAVVAKDLWVVLGFVIAFLFTGHVHVSPTRSGKMCTVMQLAMVLGVLLAPDLNALTAWPARLGGLGSAVARVLALATAVSCGLAVISYTRVGLTLLAEAERRHAAGATAADNGRRSK